MFEQLFPNKPRFYGAFLHFFKNDFMRYFISIVFIEAIYLAGMFVGSRWPIKFLQKKPKPKTRYIAFFIEMYNNTTRDVRHGSTKHALKPGYFISEEMFIDNLKKDNPGFDMVTIKSIYEFANESDYLIFKKTDTLAQNETK